jgi:hypothetical protein
MMKATTSATTLVSSTEATMSFFCFLLLLSSYAKQTYAFQSRQPATPIATRIQNHPSQTATMIVQQRQLKRNKIGPTTSSSTFSILSFSSRNFDLDIDDRAQPTQIERTDDERAYIESALRTNVLFEDVVRQGSLIDLASAFDRVEYKKGDIIMEQGDADADFMLILEEGECSIIIDGENLPDPYGTMRRGAMVGELALLLDKDRAATVTARTNVVAFRLDRDSFKRFMAGPLVKAEDIKTEIRKIDQAIDQICGVRTRYGGDIIRQYKPSRKWLWGRWRGTILQQSWRVAASNMLLSVCFIVTLRYFCKPTWAMGKIPDPNFPVIARLSALAKVWHYLMNITTFTLTFFLSQAYSLWRSIYNSTRSIQGRINDIGLLAASTVERDEQGKYTKKGEALLDEIGNYTRLFHVFFWAKYMNKFANLQSSRGMSRMLSRGIMTRTQYNTLTSLSSSNGGPHNACLTWILIKYLTAMKDKTLPNDHALRDMIFHKICGKLSDSTRRIFVTTRQAPSHILSLLPKDLRRTAGGIGDQLDGRIPLAYAHIVQILVDCFLLIAPFALYSELGIWSVMAVGILTLFYSGLLDLAKILLDPLDNDNFYDDSVNVDIGVLIRESNSGSTRWKYAAEQLPFATS